MNRTANYTCDGDNDMCEAEYDGLTSISYKENSGDVEYRSTIINQTAKMDDPDPSIIVRTWTLSVNNTISRQPTKLTLVVLLVCKKRKRRGTKFDISGNRGRRYDRK
jgi:hypothetical protein